MEFNTIADVIALNKRVLEGEQIDTETLKAAVNFVRQQRMTAQPVKKTREPKESKSQASAAKVKELLDDLLS